MGLGWGEEIPKKSALQDNVAKVRPETIGKIVQAFLRSKEALEHERGEKVRDVGRPIDEARQPRLVVELGDHRCGLAVRGGGNLPVTANTGHHDTPSGQ